MEQRFIKLSRKCINMFLKIMSTETEFIRIALIQFTLFSISFSFFSYLVRWYCSSIHNYGMKV